MARRYVVTALGPDGRVQVQATHDTSADAIDALAQLLHGEAMPIVLSPAAARRLMALWLTGGDVFDLHSSHGGTCSIAIINE